jgi:hypothetical protein
VNTKLHVVTDAKGRLLKFFLTGSQLSEYTIVTVQLDSLLVAERKLADRSDDATWFREPLKDKGYASASPAQRRAARPSDTTSGAIAAITG